LYTSKMDTEASAVFQGGGWVRFSGVLSIRGSLNVEAELGVLLVY